MDEYRPIEPYLEPEQRVRIFDPAEDPPMEYDASVYDWDEETLTVRGITHEGKPATLSPEADLVVQIYTPRGILEFQSRVVERLKATGNVILARPRRARRIQRRRFLRMDVEGRVRVERPPEETEQEAEELLMEQEGTFNVSANGIRFVTDRRDFSLASRYEVFVHIEFPEDRINPRIESIDVEAIGEVVRIATIHTEDGVFYEVAMNFVEIDQQMQDNLVRFLLRYQLFLRRHRVEVTS